MNFWCFLETFDHILEHKRICKRHQEAINCYSYHFKCIGLRSIDRLQRFHQNQNRRHALFNKPKYINRSTKFPLYKSILLWQERRTSVVVEYRRRRVYAWLTLHFTLAPYRPNLVFNRMRRLMNSVLSMRVCDRRAQETAFTTKKGGGGSLYLRVFFYLFFPQSLGKYTIVLSTEHTSVSSVC